MRKIITILMLLMMIGATSAAWYPRSDNYTTSGWIVATSGADIGGPLTGVTGAFSGTVQAEQVTSTDDMNVTDTLYVADIIQSNDAQFTNVDITTSLDVNSAATMQDITLDSGNSLTVQGTGAVSVATADKLTVGGKIIPQEIAVVWPLSASSVDESVFIPTKGYNVTAVEVRYSVAASSGPTNVTLKKCTVGEAPASGDAITSPMLLNGTVNQVYSYTPIAGSEGITAADTLCLDYSGTMTALAGGTVTITMQRV